MAKRVKTSTPFAILRIENCLDCPHSKKYQDPSSDDSFDFYDESLGCQLAADPKHKNRWNTLGLRAIAGPDRSVRRPDCTVPTWCPLASQKKARKTPAKRLPDVQGS